MHVRLIGYWCHIAECSPDEDERWPDPRDLMDESWDSQERELVASYFVSTGARAGDGEQAPA